MAFPGTFRFPELAATPSVPPAGYALIYMKTDNVLYILDSGGVETPLGSSSSITQLTGDVSAIGPGIVPATVNSVDGYTAVQIGTAVQAYIDATSANTPSVLVKRDGSGNFSAGTITANLNGNATTATSATTATNFTGSLLGDVTGTQGATIVSLVGGSTASNVNSATIAANAATAANTASTIVKRDASGNFAANIITANLSGNATTSTTSTNFSGSLLGDVTGTQSATVVSLVGGKSAASVSTSVNDTQAATSVNTASTIVKRDASGNFAAGTITANLIGTATNITAASNATLTTLSSLSLPGAQVTGNISGNAGNVTGIVAIANGGTNSSTTLNNNRIIQSSSGSIVEAAAITANRALISDTNGIPTQSVTTATELGFVSGVTSSIQAQLNSITGSGITALTGDVTATGPGSVVATVNSVGTSSATNIHLAELAANAATALNTASTIVKRDASGNFAAGTITANLTGNVSGSSASFTGSLAGDVAGTQSATVIQPNVVSNSKLAQMPTLTLKGNNTGGTANALDLTVSQVNIMLGTVTTIGTIDSQTASANGLVIVGNTLYAQSASTSNPGMVNNTTQSFSGNKTFTGSVAITPSSTTVLTINTTSFVFDSTNNALGIGTQPGTNTFIDAVNTSLASKTLQLTGYGVGSTVGTRGRFARGTSGTPAAAQSGDVINFWSARGYGASQFAVTSTAAINAVAGETFTNTSNLTYLTFLTTPTGSVTAAESMRIASTGVTIGPQSSSTAIHQLNGGLNITTRTITANLTIDTTTSDYLIYCNNSGAITVTLPTPTNGRTITLKDIAGTANINNITLARHSTEKIEGIAASRTLQTNWGQWTFTSDGTDWFMA